MDELPDDAVLVAKIEIVRYMTMSEGPHTDVTMMEDSDGSGNQLPLVECLGLLELAKDTALQTRLQAVNDDDDEED